MTLVRTHSFSINNIHGVAKADRILLLFYIICIGSCGNRGPVITIGLIITDAVSFGAIQVLVWRTERIKIVKGLKKIIFAFTFHFYYKIQFIHKNGITPGSQRP